MLNHYAGAHDQLTAYEQKIKSSFQNAGEASKASKLAVEASDEDIRKQHLAQAEAFRIKAAQDMKDALALYGKLYDQVKQNGDTKALDSLMKMQGQGQEIAEKNNLLAAASVDHAQQVTTLGASVMMAKYLLQGNSADKVLLRKTTDLTMAKLLGIDSGQILSILDAIDKNGLVSYKTMETSLEQLDQATFKLGDFAKDLAALWDGSQMQEIGSYAPQWVKDIGNLPRLAAQSATYQSNDAMAELLRATLHGRADISGNTEQFIADFKTNLASYATDDKAGRIEFLVETAVSAMNVPIADRDEYYQKMKQLQAEGYSPIAAYNTAATGAIRYMELNQLADQAQLFLEETKDLLESYKVKGNPDTAYYPAQVLLNYLKSLNQQLEYVYANRAENGTMRPLPDSSLGRYRNIWIYKGEEGQLLPEQVEYKDLYLAFNQLNSALAKGYTEVADRWNLNLVKTTVTASAVMGAALSFGSGTTMAGIGLVNSLANSMGDAVVGPWADSLNKADSSTAQLMARAAAEVYVNSGLAAAKTYQVAQSVQSVFAAVDQWKKIDPPLPIMVLGVDVSDITIGDDEEFGQGHAVINIRNDHSGAITVAPIIQIIDGNGVIYSASVPADSVGVGESRQFVADIYAPKATLRDPAGFDLYLSFELAEPSSMSIAGLHGPYVKHFMTGNEAQITAMRSQYDYSIPRSGYLGGEGNPVSDTVTFTAKEGSAELRILLAALDGSNISMEVSGAGLDTAELRSIVREGDLLVIKNPSGDYAINIQGSNEEEYYTLQIGQLPDLGTVFDMVPPGNIMADAALTETQEVETEISIYESSGNGELEEVDLEVTSFIGLDGEELSLPDLSTRIFGQTLAQSSDFSVAAGDGKVLVPQFTLPAQLEAGSYTIGLKV